MVATSEDLTVSANPTELVIAGITTFQIGDGGTPTTVIIEEQTVTLGREGVGLDSTTIAIPLEALVLPFRPSSSEASRFR